MQGKIVKIISDDHFVDIKTDTIICKARGIFRKDNASFKVGDQVIINEKEKVIEKLLPRKNELDRPVVSNIDEAFIITSLKDPNFNTNLLDKLLTVCEINKIKPVICLTKKDLLSKDEYKKLKPVIKYYKKMYKVIYNTQIFKIKKMFKNKTIVFTGQTGAGKSSLINNLDKSLNFETNEISKALGRGKHTTRYVTLVPLYKGFVLDTPGFSAISLENYTDEQIKDSFIEFNKYNCPYKDCNHINEKDCNIRGNKNILKSRYENYVKFIEKR